MDIGQMFIEHFYKFIITGFFTIITLLLRSLFKSYKKSIELRQEALEYERIEQGLLKEGILSLLRYRINRLCIHIASQGYMTIDEKNDLVDLFKAYSKLGGNSRTAIMYDNVMDTFDVKNVGVTLSD